LAFYLALQSRLALLVFGGNMIKLELSIEEVNGILQTLGQLPTSSGAWPLVVKIKEQAESQVPQDQAPGE
jgi:hypothetical protein